MAAKVCHYHIGRFNYTIIQDKMDNMDEESKNKKDVQELARVRAQRKSNRRIAQIKAFNIKITPKQYRGMHFLGNFRSKDHRNSLDDVRLSHLSHEYFLNKQVLDVGAGDGAVTVEIAIRMLPEQIVALDIDADLLGLCQKRIDRLVENSEKYSAVSRNEEIQLSISQLPAYFQEAAKKISQRHIIKSEKYLEILPTGLTVTQEFPRNISIMNENFFNLEATSQYDTITCLDTVKWLHLALGDSGIQTFFSKVHDLLKPGGHFILEYSDYPSYHKRKGFSELFKENFKNNIKIYPINFPSLLKFSGFDQIGDIQGTPERPLKHALQIYAKSANSQSV